MREQCIPGLPRKKWSGNYNCTQTSDISEPSIKVPGRGLVAAASASQSASGCFESHDFSHFSVLIRTIIIMPVPVEELSANPYVKLRKPDVTLPMWFEARRGGSRKCTHVITVRHETVKFTGFRYYSVQLQTIT